MIANIKHFLFALAFVNKQVEMNCQHTFHNTQQLILSYLVNNNCPFELLTVLHTKNMKTCLVNTKSKKNWVNCTVDSRFHYVQLNVGVSIETIMKALSLFF